MKLFTLILVALLSGCAYPIGYYGAAITMGVNGYAPIGLPYQPTPYISCNSVIVPIYDGYGNLIGRRFVCR